MKILIADDNANNRQLVEDIVISLGYTPLMARNGQEALKQTIDWGPDLVILDVDMPEMDGFAVCACLKDNPDTRHIPILMVTAMADIDNRLKGLGLGAADYLTKPFSPRELAARINTQLRIKSNTDELRATKEIIRQTFERFVQPQVVQALLNNPEDVHLGGKLQPVTVCFTDLEGFTTVAESSNPETLLSVLNRYQGLMVEHILAHEGTVNKFTGDGIMALYNTPLFQEDHVLRAIKTAISIQQALPTFHAQLDAPFRLGINFGIHTGEAVVGMVGTEKLMEYTAIGDTVNLASRLEDMSHNGKILISDAVYQAVQTQIETTCLGPQVIKNRATPVVVYEVIKML